MPFEIFSLINNLNITSQAPAQIIGNPSYNASLENVSETLVSEQNSRFKNIINNITNNASCPIPALPVAILLNPQNQTTITPKLTYPNYKIGNYYRIPVSSELGNQGRRIPKYSANIPLPFFGFIYPPGDAYAGYMLVKTLQPFQNPPQDVLIINENQVLDELQRVIKTIFAM